MKNLLRAGAAILVLAAMTAALIFVFATMGRSRGQPPAQDPTPIAVPAPLILTNPIITPSVSITGTPTPVAPIVIDPTWNPPTPTPFPPRPTFPPSPATGGPYLSGQEAIEIALRGARLSGEVKLGAPPKAIFTPAKNVEALLGHPRPGVESEREKWLVFIEGRFPLPRAPKPPPEKIFFGEYVAVIDSTTGNLDSWGVRNRLP